MIIYNDKPKAKMDTVKCYHSHTKQDFGVGITLYGGSCITPIIGDADIYLGLEKGMRIPDHAVPWNGGASVFFHIQNMMVPKDDKKFIDMLEWAAIQLDSKKSMHIGCIGGHGRTGLVMAGLKYLMTSDKDAILYLRKNYCKKAVESEMQMDYLHKLFGLTKAPPVYQTFNQYQDVDYIPAPKKKGMKQDDLLVIDHMPVQGSIW